MHTCTCMCMCLHMHMQIKWYTLDDKEWRGYKLLPQEHHIVVNAMIRLGGLHFEGSQGGPQGRSFRGRERGDGLSFLGLDTKHLLVAACDGD